MMSPAARRGGSGLREAADRPVTSDLVRGPGGADASRADPGYVHDDHLRFEP